MQEISFVKPFLLKSSKVWGWFYSKNFSRATFFVFWGTHLVAVFLNNMLMKQIWRKSAVWVRSDRSLVRWSFSAGNGPFVNRIQLGNTFWDFPTFNDKEEVLRRKKTRDKTMVATINTAIKVNRAKKQFRGEDKEKVLQE